MHVGVWHLTKYVFILLFPSVSPAVLASPNNLQTLKPKFCNSGSCVHLNQLLSVNTSKY